MSKTTEEYKAEIKRLMQDVDIALDQAQAALKSEFDAWQKVEKLERELAEVRKDAIRYRSLRGSGNYSPSVLHGYGWALGGKATHKQLDDAADALIAASVAQANKEQE